jgi:hypothetical protein
LTEIRLDDYAWLEVEDQGGAWIERETGDDHGRGLVIVAALAGDGNWTVEEGTAPGSRVVWVWLDWAARLAALLLVPAWYCLRPDWKTRKKGK